MNYTLGLDIGISSIGWAVLENDITGESEKIADLGVRIFDAAEHRQTGASLAAPRREARSSRRRLRRRRHRKERIRNLLVDYGVIEQNTLDNLFESTYNQIDIYTLRKQALDNLLTSEEWTRVLIHLAQRRGYNSNSTAEETEAKDTGVLKLALRDNETLMEKKGYRTIGEMFCLDEKFSITMPDGTIWRKTRNSYGEYNFTVTRVQITDEICKLFEAQRQYKSTFADSELEEKYKEILLSQRHFDEGPGGNSPFARSERRGLCTFERKEGELRAYKATYTFEYFKLLQDINHIKITSSEHPALRLSSDQRELIIAQSLKTENIDYGRLRKLLNLEENQYFNCLNYGEKSIEEVEKKNKFKQMQSYHKLRKAMDKVSKNFISNVSHDVLDKIAECLSAYKADEKRKEKLTELGLDNSLIEVLLPLSFSSAGHLSIKAMKNLIPHLEQGVTYDKACAEVYGDHRGSYESLKTNKLSFNKLCEDGVLDGVNNPVVIRAVSQTCKVVNAIVRQYGAPQFVRIELTREMSKNFNDRNKAKKFMEENFEKNEKAKMHIEEIKGGRATGQDLVKWKLFQEQGEICPYSGMKLESKKLFEDGYVDIDHIIPYSISFDDSYQNKALVLTSENRQKGNRLPLQYMESDEEKTQRYITFVETNIRNYRKRQKLLKQSLTYEDEKDFKARNLVDTQYITKTFYHIVEGYLALAPHPQGKTKQVFAVNGVVTDYIRKRLGIEKIRDNGDLHHAVDAAVVATVSTANIQKISRYAKRRECQRNDRAGGYLDYETGEIMTKDAYDEKYAPHFPEPWLRFRKELEARLSPNANQEIQYLRMSTYDPHEIVKPVFVSRMPNRKVTGPAHNATIRSGKISGCSIVKTPLQSLKLDKNGEVTPSLHGCDRLLHEAILEKLQLHEGKGKIAFSEPFYKPKADGTPGPLVKKVKTIKKSNLNVAVHGGVAKNSDMVRIDVFYIKNKGYYFVPIYTADVVKECLPNKAVTRDRPYEQWLEMSPNDFLFSLYSRDLISVQSNKNISLAVSNKKATGEKELFRKEWVLYYRGADISNASITVETHDRKYETSGLGVKLLVLLEKYEVDVLGNYHKVKVPETRRTFH